MHAQIHLRSAAEQIAAIARRPVSVGEVEDVFWLVINTARDYDKGEISASYLTYGIEVYDENGAILPQESLVLTEQMAAQLR